MTPEQVPTPENVLVAVGRIDPGSPRTLLQLDSGRIVILPTELLMEQLSVTLENQDLTSEGITVIPLLAEELVVTKRQVPTETVRLVKTTEEILGEAEVSLTQEYWEVSRFPVNTEIAVRAGIRHDGDTAIYPVYEERLVTRKALFLVEEVHVQKRIETRDEVVHDSLQRDVLTVERITR